MQRFSRKNIKCHGYVHGIWYNMLGAEEQKLTDLRSSMRKIAQNASQDGFSIDSQVNLTDNESKTMSKGTKFDAGKPRLSLIPVEALNEEAKVFGFGAAKYGRDNYKLGMDWTRLVDAALRHVTAFGAGEDTDPESGLSHLGHARCCLSMLLFYVANSKGTDDRYKISESLATTTAPKTNVDKDEE